MSRSRTGFVAGLSLALLLAGLAPAAAAGPSIGRLGIGGTGCPAGTAYAALGGGGATLSVGFTQYRAVAGGARSFERKACGIAIPFTAPAGKSVAIVGVTYRGRNSLPAGAKATIAAEIFFAGGNGPKVSRSFSGPTSGKFSFSTAAAAPVWSACGASFNLRIQSSIRVETAGGRVASISIRSQDVAAGLIYQLRYRSC
ncbi:MAG TPA: DUF4360 domain-containing protein [Devosia sp.]|nr:DUF4360 domain-containing protein [Devosia sp.]